MWTKIKNSITLNILLALAAAWVLFGAVSMVSQAIFLSKEAREREAKIEELSRKKVELETYIGELESRSAIEREAKIRLNLKLPGEEVVVVVPEKEDPSAGSGQEKKFLEKIKYFFINFFNL